MRTSAAMLPSSIGMQRAPASSTRTSDVTFPSPTGVQRAPASSTRTSTTTFLSPIGVQLAPASPPLGLPRASTSSPFSDASSSASLGQSQLSWPLSSNDMATNFTVVNLNVQGLLGSGCNNAQHSNGSYAKVDFLRHLCSSSATPDVICLSETKLSKIIDSAEIELPGYSVFRRYRNRHGGGIAVHYLNTLDATPLDLSVSPCAPLKCVALKVMSRIKSFIFATYYRPPSSKANWLDLFSDSLEYLLSFNLPLVVSGDFNINLRSDSTFADNMKADFDLKQIINEPTRIVKHSATLIAHVYVSRDVGVHNQGIFNHTSLITWQCMC